MKKKILFLSILSFFLSVSVALACSPCQSILSLEETIEKAQVVVIGQKISEAPDPDGINGPEWVEIKVSKILKGSIDSGKIKVAAWYGMCPYGLANLSDKGNYMLFLGKEDQQPFYGTVDSGCSVKKLWVENDTIVYHKEDETEVSIDEFAERFNLEQPVVVKPQIDNIPITKDCADDTAPANPVCKDTSFSTKTIILTGIGGGLILLSVLIFLSVKFFKNI